MSNPDKSHSPLQLPLALPEVDAAQFEALVLTKARGLFEGSRYLSARFASFERVMAEPVTGRCLRLAASALLRSGAKRTRGR